MSPSPSEVDDDFAEFVRARQHELSRAAALVCGDAAVGHEVTEGAIVALALRWSKIHDESPDTYVRSILYRDAIAVKRSGTHEPDVLERLSPKERAVTVLRHFEHRTERETADILGMSVGAVRSRAHAGDGMDGLLADAAEPVVERDFVEAARAGAAALRERRRRVGLLVAAALALVAAGLFLLPRGSTTDRATPAPSPSTPNPTSSAPGGEWEAGAFDLFNVAAQVGPSPGQVTTLPRIDDLMRRQLALPEVLAFSASTLLPTLSEVGTNSAPVRAVLLRYSSEGLRPVLVRPTLSNPFMLVDTMNLTRNVDEAGNASEPLETTAIASDRRHVMFIQAGKVLVLDAFSGEVTTFPVEDRYLTGGGWAADGASIIVWSQTRQWRITTSTGAVQRLGRAAYPGLHQIVVAGDDGVRVLEFDERGATTRTLTGPRVLSDVWGSTFTNVDTRVATGGFLSQAAAMQANQRRPQRLFQGVFTVDSLGMTSARLLIAPGSEGVATGCCEVLGWAYTDQILIRWNSRDLLAWDVRTGGLRRVSTLPGSQEAAVVGAPARVVALAP